MNLMGVSFSTRVVMVGLAIPEDVMKALMQADPSPQIQTYKLSWAVIHGVESTGNIVDLISTVPINDYPKADWLWSGYRRWDRGNGSENRVVPFINILGHRHPIGSPEEAGKPDFAMVAG